MKNINLNWFLSIICMLALSSISTAALAEGEMCSLCATNVDESSSLFVVNFKDGRSTEFGCPGCGLKVVSVSDVKSVKTMDFLTRKMIDAESAYYLKGTEIGFCCQPNWLSFDSKENAEKFSKGFGGEVLDYKQAVASTLTDLGAN